MSSSLSIVVERAPLPRLRVAANHDTIGSKKLKAGFFEKKVVGIAEKLKIAYRPAPIQSSKIGKLGPSGEGMRRRIGHFRSVLLALAGLCGLTSPVFAQGLGSVGGPAQGIGTVGGPIAQPIQVPPPQPPQNIMADFDTYVSFIDSALPRSQARVLFDFAEHIRQPTRAEFFQPKGGLPGSPGPPLPET